MIKDERLPKQFGDFAENLVMFILGKFKGKRVALVDHIGADIIATSKTGDEKFAISVKGRNFPKSESYQFNFSKGNVEKLKDFSESFNMIPTIAFVFCDDMEGEEKIRIFMLKLKTLEKMAFDSSNNIVTISKGYDEGYNFKYAKGRKVDYLSIIKKRNDIDYTEIKIEKIDEFLKI